MQINQKIYNLFRCIDRYQCKTKELLKVQGNKFRRFEIQLNVKQVVKKIKNRIVDFLTTCEHLLFF